MKEITFSLAYLEELGGGNPEFTNEMIDLFLTTTQEIMGELEKACQENNRAGVKFYAHKLKSTARMFSITPLTEKLEELEEQAESGLSQEAVMLRCALISNLCAQSIIEISKHKSHA